MRLSLSFAYPITTRVQRARTWREFYNLSTVALDVLEIDGEAATLVCEVSSDLNDGMRDKYCRSAFLSMPADGGVRPARVVNVDGKLYVERCLVDELLSATSSRGERNPFDVTLNQDGEATPLLGPSRRMANGEGYETGDDDDYTISNGAIPPKRPPAKSCSKDELETHYQRKFAEIRDDGGDIRRLELARRAAEMRIIGGSVYVPVAEPRFIVDIGISTMDNPDGKHKITFGIRVVESSRASPFGWILDDLGGRMRGKYDESATFALDRLDAARAYITTLLELKGADHDDFRVGVEDLFEIKNLDRSTLHEDASDILGRAGDFIGHLSSTKIFELSAVAVAAWCEVRDAAWGCASSSTLLASALRSFVSAAPQGCENEIAFASTALAEYDFALAQGRAWKTPGPVVDTLGDGIVAKQLDGWSALPPELIGRLSERFQPGVDRLVMVERRPRNDSGHMYVTPGCAGFVFGGANEPLAEVFWGEVEGSQSQRRDLALSNVVASRECEKSLSADEDLVEMPGL